MKNNNIKYFFASNSADGFVSFFNTCYNPLDGWRCAIIKGGPGSGKSSFMKKLLKHSENPTLCYCGSDPDSLDAVLIPEKKLAILDGTAPHTQEPLFPGVSEEILNFGEYWNETQIRENRDEIIALTLKNKAEQAAASEYLKAAGLMLRKSLNFVKNYTNIKKCKKAAVTLAKKYIKSDGAKADTKHRFLGGVTPKGVVYFSDTILLESDTQIIISDTSGAVADIILKTLTDYALEKNHGIILLHNPLLPEILDGVIIPSLKLSFIREYDFLKLPLKTRRIHETRFINKNCLSEVKSELKRNKKEATRLLNLGIATLKKAKTLHDDLEQFYVKAMDFLKLEKLSEAFIKENLL